MIILEYIVLKLKSIILNDDKLKLRVFLMKTLIYPGISYSKV